MKVDGHPGEPATGEVPEQAAHRYQQGVISHLLRGTAALALPLALATAAAPAHAAEAPPFTCDGLTFQGGIMEAGPCGASGTSG